MPEQLLLGQGSQCCSGVSVLAALGTTGETKQPPSIQNLNLKTAGIVLGKHGIGESSGTARALCQE